MITAVLALLISTSVIWAEVRGKPSTIRRKVLNGYSDSQIMQGIGIQSVGLANMSSLIPYHFFLIWMLSLLSMATHNATLLALVHDYRRDWVLRWLRQFLMFVNLALSSVSGIFVLQVVYKGLVHSTLPVACVWNGEVKGTSGDTGVSFVGTIAVMAANGIIFALATWYLHSRNQRFFKAIQIIGLLLMAASAIGVAIRVIYVAQAFGGNTNVKLSDEGEKSWSFGQSLSMLLLIMPLVSAIEIYRGDMKVAPPLEDERQPLYDGELQSGLEHHRFQPNPFFGSESNLFKK